MAIYYWKDWTPGSDTIAYLRLNSATGTSDEIGTYTWNGDNITYDSISAYFNGTSSKIVATSNFGDENNLTISFRCKCTLSDMSGKDSQRGTIFFDGTSAGGNDFAIFMKSNGCIRVAYKGDNSETDLSLGGWDDTKFNCITVCAGSGYLKLYKNGELVSSSAVSGGANISYHNNPAIGNLVDGSSHNERYKGYLSNLLIANTIWSVDKVENYYNNTKSLYGY